MAVLVLQALAVQRGAAGGGADQEAARTLVAGGPAQVEGALQAEHRVGEVEGDHLHAMHRVGGGSGDPVADRAGLVDPFLQHLPGLRFLVEHQLVVVFGNVALALLAPDADLAEHALHAEGARLVGDDRDDALAESPVLEQEVHDAYDRHRRRQLAPLAGGLEQRGEGLQRRQRQRLRPAPALRQVATERGPARVQVAGLLGVLGE